MQVLYDKAQGPTGGVLTLGTFDGVHLGHRALLEACLAQAKALQTHPEVWLYHPHPRTVLRGQPVPLLTTLEERLHLLAQAGVAVVRIVSFTPQLAQLSAEDFIGGWIEAVAQPKRVILGYDHRFGRARAGSAQLLAQRGFSVIEVQPYVWEGAPVSSSRIRQRLMEGAVEAAAQLLGYPYTVGGQVRQGQQRARHFGTPTANIPWPEEKVRPSAGIYTGRVLVEPPSSAPAQNGFPALLYLPPVGDLEVHLLEGPRALYGATLRVGFLKQLRPHQEFSDPDKLAQQIQADLLEAQQFFRLT